MCSATPIPTIVPCPQPLQANCLHLLFADLAENVRQSQVQSLLLEQQVKPTALSGLFAALEHDQLVGAVLARSLGGRAAFIWPARIRDGYDSAVVPLYARACDWCQAGGMVLAQALPANDATFDHERLLQAGFSHAADLLYLLCPDREFPRERPESGLEFEPYTPEQHERFKEVVSLTYEETRDCPSVDGLRELDDVLEGYRATGIFDPARWLIVRRDGRDVGCLILGDDGGEEHFELVYMGVIAAARGAELGLSIVRHAQWLTARAARRRMVLSVDAANEPALNMYSRAGFIAWDQRAVFVKSLKP